MLVAEGSLGAAELTLCSPFSFPPCEDPLCFPSPPSHHQEKAHLQGTVILPGMGKLCSARFPGQTFPENGLPQEKEGRQKVPTMVGRGHLTTSPKH